MQYRLRTLLIVLALGPLVLAGMCNSKGDGWPKASRTAYDVMSLSLLCEGLNEQGFDFESIENVRQLLDALAARSKYRVAEFEGDSLLKTPYGSEYQYRFLKNECGCFVEISAEVPNYVPKRLKDKMRRHIEVRCSGDAKP